MKVLPVLISLLLLCHSATAAKTVPPERPCNPLIGQPANEAEKELNILKNRSQPPRLFDYDPTITIGRILAPGNDTNRFPATKAATITGYVTNVRVGGIESSNCYAKDAAHRDTHIDIVADPKYAVPQLAKIRCPGKPPIKDLNEKYHVIVEVTPHVRDQQRAKGVDWSTDTLAKHLTHHWVRFSGWILFDWKHSSDAENTHPGNKCNWRATSTEIHPIFAIKVVR